MGWLIGHTAHKYGFWQAIWRKINRKFEIAARREKVE